MASSGLKKPSTFPHGVLKSQGVSVEVRFQGFTPKCTSRTAAALYGLRGPRRTRLGKIATKVDGRNAAPTEIFKTLQLMGYLQHQLMQDF